MPELKKVLVAEDDPFLRKVYETKFAKAGFEIKAAKDGLEVFQILAGFIPDVILLDLIMPRLDGFETLKGLKSDPKWKNIPVIVTSNLGQVEDKKKATELGAAEYCVKSELPIQQLIDLVKSKIKA